MDNQNQQSPITAPGAVTAPVVPPVAAPAAAPVAGATLNAPATKTKPDAPVAKAVAETKTKVTPPKASNDVFVRKIVDKIKSSENILVALSRDPSVDEIAAAIGLTLFLDSLQKHTTAIYSGQTPDALQFLQPEGTFETNTDSLRDFIIALNKDKADHLRYKLDGDFVKVYITPYKSDINEDDLEFSHGDYNVNLVLALGVPSAGDLDAALLEHGRIMHDATTVDITIGEPGKFAEIEWSDLGASSVSEMVTKVIFAMQGEDAVLDKETATALLTGIVAATGRFSNDRTNSDTMQLASKLMAMGADQQLISAHVMDNDSNGYSVSANAEPARTDLVVSHDESVSVANNGTNTPVMESAAAVVVEPVTQTPSVPTSDLAAAANAAVSEAMAAVAPVAQAVSEAPATTMGQMTTAPTVPVMTVPEKKDYSEMMAEALAEVSNNPVAQAAPVETVVGAPSSPIAQAAPVTMGNPAAQAAPVETAMGPEPVAKPSGVTLPPPPPPMPTADMMPPTQSNAFQIPGMG